MTFAIASVLGWIVVVGLAATIRSRAYATFRGVALAVHSLIAVALAPRFAWAMPVYAYLHAMVFVHSIALARPRLRPLAYRALVSLPAAFFGAGTVLALPWAIAAAFGAHMPAPWAPYIVAAIGLAQSLSAREEEVDLVVADGAIVDGVRPHPPQPGRVGRPLRVVQITDPHLGPFMSVSRLRQIATRAAERKPDLVVLTGDFLTMESQSDPTFLATALEPLRALPGRVFACLGNHDHEALETVRAALAHVGAKLLVDDAALIETPAGPVQILGVDFVWRGRKEHLQRVVGEHPRIPGALRLVLLHDPGAFRHVPEGQADLVLSGHTHGGQVGLVSLGLPWTMVRLFTDLPDHGAWARGTDRLYVHRGTGHYGFPLRIGVPSEASLVRVHAIGLWGA